MGALILLALFPPAFFGLAYLSRLGWSREPSPGAIREPMVDAAVISATVLVLGTELLSALRSIHQGMAIIGWGVAIAAAVTIAVWRGALSRGWSRPRRSPRRWAVADVLVLAGLGLAAVVVFVVAVVAPPNNVDSLNHHMPRVAHWAQNASLEAYPSLRNGQISKPPMAELAILTVRVLTGGDRLANVIQWAAMAVGLCIVSLITFRLGGGRRAQLLSAVFAFSVPLGVLLASNTKNDHVVTLWALCLAYYALVAIDRPLTKTEVALAGLAIGLGILTKGTFYPFAFPIAILVAIGLWRHHGWKRAAGRLLLLLAVAAALNLPYWARNLKTFGGPYGSPLGLQRALEVDEAVSAPPSGEGSRGWRGGLGGVVATFGRRLAAMATLNTVYPEIGPPLRDLLGRVPGLYDEAYLGSLEEGLWNHEDSAGNLVHGLLLTVALAGAGSLSLRQRDARPIAYALAVAAGYAGLALVTSATELWGLRYQLSFFVLGAPLVGVVAGRLVGPRAQLALCFGLLVLAAPYVVLNNTRPLISALPRTRVASVLTASQLEILTAASPGLGSQYAEAATALQASTCREVGLRIQRGDLEYILWWLLSAPQSGFRLEAAVATPETAGLVDPSIEPCAIVCTVCGPAPIYRRLPLRLDAGEVRLYGADGFGW